MLKRLLAAALQMGLGLALGLALLEVVLRLNSQLLIPGTPLAGSLTPPLTTQTYTVRYSDGDTFFWRPDLIRPLAPADDLVEAQVTLATDEFGFRNLAPLPSKVDGVVLGRSTSLGAQAAQPWPALLAAATGQYVLNLAQPSLGLDDSRAAFDRYGRPRQPRWVIFEVAPRIDVGDAADPPLRLQGTGIPMLQYLARRLAGNNLIHEAAQPIYPLQVDLPGRSVALTCCLNYMDFLAMRRSDLEASQAWAAFRASVLRLAADARAGGSCVAVLYATSKEEVYFSAALHPEQLAPAVNGVVPLYLDAHGHLAPDSGTTISPQAMQRNVLASHDALVDFVRGAGLPLIDPTPALIQAVRAGQDPFMAYDSHWNALGHQLIAAEAQRSLPGGDCP